MQNEAWTREKITQLKIDPVDARIYDEVKMVWDNLKQLLQRLVQFL